MRHTVNDTIDSIFSPSYITDMRLTNVKKYRTEISVEQVKRLLSKSQLSEFEKQPTDKKYFFKDYFFIAKETLTEGEYYFTMGVDTEKSLYFDVFEE